MRNLNTFILERLRINKDISPIKYNYQPKDFNELKSLLKQLLEKRGKDADLNDIDVSKITSFYDNINKRGLFEKLDPHNINISQWDVSNVENMNSMFDGCKNFTGQGLKKWNVSNVEDMGFMFDGCTNFEGNGLENWKLIKCENMHCMFYKCINFNHNLGSWNVSNIEDMFSMFEGCENFKGDGLEKWKPINCQDMRNMFENSGVKKYPSWYEE